MIYRRLMVLALLAGLAAAGCDDANKGNSTVAQPAGEQKRGNKAGGGMLPKPPPVEKVGP